MKPLVFNSIWKLANVKDYDTLDILARSLEHYSAVKEVKDGYTFWFSMLDGTSLRLYPHDLQLIEHGTYMQMHRVDREIPKYVSDVVKRFGGVCTADKVGETMNVVAHYNFLRKLYEEKFKP